MDIYKCPFFKKITKFIFTKFTHFYFYRLGINIILLKYNINTFNIREIIRVFSTFLGALVPPKALDAD
jgi:Na+/citrate or Na+/malate symporter